MLHRYPTDTIQGQADSYSGHACLNKMLISPKRAEMLNDVKAKLCTYPVISEDSAQCLTLNDNSKMTSIILSKSSITEQSPLRPYASPGRNDSTHTSSSPVRYQRQVIFSCKSRECLCLIKQRHNKDGRAYVQSSAASLDPL